MNSIQRLGDVSKQEGDLFVLLRLFLRGKQKFVSYILTVVSDVKRTHAEMIDILTHAKGIQYIEEL